MPTIIAPGIAANNRGQDIVTELEVKIKIIVNKAQMRPPIPRCVHLSIPQDLKYSINFFIYLFNY